jgi:hypothetical protein
VTHVAVDGGMGDNLEVSLTGQRFEATIVNRVGGGEMVSVVGRHCESGDQLVDGVPLQRPAIGDLLAVPVTGAYCYTMSNQYNGARRVPVVFARNGKPRLVVRRDTWDDLVGPRCRLARGKMGGMTDLPGSLVELARLYGVATEYVDWTGRQAGVTDSTLIAVLDALGVPAATEDERIAALAAYDRDYWARPLPRRSSDAPASRRRSGYTSRTEIPSGCGCGWRTAASVPAASTRKQQTPF